MPRVQIGFYYTRRIVWHSVNTRTVSVCAQLVEYRHELTIRQSHSAANQLQNAALRDLLSRARDVTDSNTSDVIVSRVLVNLTSALTEWTRDDRPAGVCRWTFPGALLYSVSVVTTVGQRQNCLYLSRAAR